MCTDYAMGGLRMVDPQICSQAQKMLWVKKLFDDNYSSNWKTIEFAALSDFHPNCDILWNSNPPEKVLTGLKNTQVADSIRSWHFFKDKAIRDNGFEPSDFSFCEVMQFNKNVHSKSNSNFYFPDWYDKGIVILKDLLNEPKPNILLLFQNMMLIIKTGKNIIL